MMRICPPAPLFLCGSMIAGLALVEARPRQDNHHRQAAAAAPGSPSRTPAVPYLGMKPPGVTPELFAPGLVSTGLAERDVAISPDGREIYLAVTFRTTTTIMTAQFKRGRWTPPTVASFAADLTYYNMEPCMSGDGRQVFFLTNRPRAGGAYGEPERLPDVINGTGATFNACVAPDEQYLIAGVEGRDDSTPPKKANYYVFFRSADGTWAPGVNPGPVVNDPANTVHSPYISPDGKYLFFASNASRDRSPTPPGPLTLPQLVDLSRSPQNGNSDIYWVRAEVIEQLRRAHE